MKDREIIRIFNTSNQLISIQLTVAGVDFFRGQQQIHLNPNNHIEVDTKYLIDGQVENLKMKGLLKTSIVQ
jgi:hypothetical protein